MKTISCGFIVNTKDGWLICHSTGNSHWDFPKGTLEPGETHIQAAIREANEETGLDLSDYADSALDLGCWPYNKQKQLHMFMIEYTQPLDLTKLICTSMVDKGTYKYPEVDRFAVVPPEEAMCFFGKSMKAWVEAHVPKY
jgi:8-oxo-dGTP pyrophosphatase MutT (NUDIX family)